VNASFTATPVEDTLRISDYLELPDFISNQLGFNNLVIFPGNYPVRYSGAIEKIVRINIIDPNDGK
jgi:hypothetical protein